MSDANHYPIVLAHGIARFDFLVDAFLKKLNLALWDLSFAHDRLHYFKGIASYLHKQGIEAYATRVGFADSVDERARALKSEILNILARSGQAKVHIIGHSMGGLDARHMVVNEHMAGRVASITSIGTPHLGTTFADWSLAQGGHRLIGGLHDVVDLSGFEDLTIQARAAFNAHAQDQEASNEVIYQVYAASQARALVFAPLQPSYDIIFEAEGANDGLVSTTSQLWVSKLAAEDGTEKIVRQKDFPVPADHLNQTGWWDLHELNRFGWWKPGLIGEKRRFEARVKQAYLEIVRSLQDQAT